MLKLTTHQFSWTPPCRDTWKYTPSKTPLERLDTQDSSKTHHQRSMAAQALTAMTLMLRFHVRRLQHPGTCQLARAWTLTLVTAILLRPACRCRRKKLLTFAVSPPTATLKMTMLKSTVSPSMPRSCVSVGTKNRLPGRHCTAGSAWSVLLG